MTKLNKLSRRDFLKTTGAVAAAATTGAGSVLADSKPNRFSVSHKRNRTNTSMFRLMSWNLQNLFDPETDSSFSREEYEAKLSGLVQVITNLNPDVVGVQEVGSQAALDDLIAQLNAAATSEADHYTGQLSSFPDGRGIRTGFLTKKPILNIHEVHDIPVGGLVCVPGAINTNRYTQNITAFTHGAIGITIEMKDGFLVTIFNAHFKSKLVTYSASGGSRFSPLNELERALAGGAALMKRTGEAVGLRIAVSSLLEADEDAAVIVLGDLNDVTDAATTQILLGPDGSRIGTIGFDRPDMGDRTRLFNLAPLIPEERQYSRVYQGSGELIDHIMVSVKMLPGDPHVLPIVDSHVDNLEGLPSLTEDPHDWRAKPVSDHAPITATFDLDAFA